MVDTTLFLPGLSPVQGKAVVARFDGGRLSSEGGLLVLREVERRLGLADGWPLVSRTHGHRKRSCTAWRRSSGFAC
jgi:hypothetical protein